MENVRKSPPELHLESSIEKSRITEVKSHGGRTIGHVINGAPDGPNLVVAGTTAGVRSVFQRVLLDPVALSLKGRLLLLFLDQLDHAETQGALEIVAKCMSPITETLFLEVPTRDHITLADDLSVETILNLCQRHGAIDPASHRAPATSARTR